MLGELQKPQALCTGKEVGVVKKLTSEGFTLLRSGAYFVSEGRDSFRGLSGQATCVDEFKHYHRAFGVGFYSLVATGIQGWLMGPSGWFWNVCLSILRPPPGTSRRGSDQGYWERKAIGAKSAEPSSH